MYWSDANELTLYMQLFGALLFCLVFLYLWRQSGIVYFGLWSMAWAARILAVGCGFGYYLLRSVWWLAPHAFFEFTFALALVAAARAGLSRGGRTWHTTRRLLLAFAGFLACIFLMGLQAQPESYRWIHMLLLGFIYLYHCRSVTVGQGVGGKLFRISLLCLAFVFLHNALAYSWLNYTGRIPAWMAFLASHRLFDFALHIIMTFGAMAVWIEIQSARVREIAGELDRVLRESLNSQEIDHLTGLLNRGALEKRLADPGVFEGVVAVCDMDRFKEVNDSHGHLTGDEILRNIGHLLRASIRGHDEAFRWGGDEFVIFFHNQQDAVARQRMQEIERRLGSFRVRGLGMLPISFSWGTAEATGDSMRDVLEEADRRMYALKRERAGQ